MFEFLYGWRQNKRYEMTIKIILALIATLLLLTFSQSAAALSEQLCAKKKVAHVNTPIHNLNQGKLIRLITIH